MMGTRRWKPCVQQAVSVPSARDEESVPESDHDYDDVNQEVEACVQQAASATTVRDEVSVLAPDFALKHKKREVYREDPSPHARIFTEDELDAVARGEPSLMADEKEEYGTELEERLFPFDEVEMAKRYWLKWYKETLAASEVAKRANRDFRAIKEDVNASPEVASVLGPTDRERFLYEDGVVSSPRSVGPKRPVTTDETIVRENNVVSLCSGESTTIASVGNPTPAKTGRLLPSRWRALVRRAVYQLVKAEDLPGTNPCPSCSSPLYSQPNGCRKPRADDSTKNGDLAVRACSVLKRSVTSNDERLIEKLVSEVVSAFATNATLIRSKVMERGSRCHRCRSLSNLPTRGATVKSVSFDCSSLFSPRSEAFGSNGSRHDQEDGVFKYVYVVSRAEPPGGRRPGLREVPGLPEPDDITIDSFVDGKRIIGSIGGVEAVSVGFIDCVPTDMLIDTGAVASLVDARVLKLVGRGSTPLRPCRRDLNSASGHPLRIRGEIDLPLQLGSREVMRPFIVVDKLHIDMILGTDALKAFRAVVDLDKNLVTLKDTGEKFSIGSPRVEEMYSTKICSTVRIRPGGQALVVTDVLGELAEDTTVLVEGLIDLDASVRVAPSLCTVHNKKVVVEVCNPSTEEMVVKKGTLVAAVSVVPASAFKTSSIPSCAEQSELFSPEGNASTKREFDWVHAAITASSHTANAPPSAMPELDKVLQNELNIDFSESKLGNEQKELFSDLLSSFKDMFVETSMKPGRTNLLEFSIDTGNSAPIKQRPYRVSKAEGDVMEAEIQQYQELNLIRPSPSPWASPVLMIRKPDGGIRFCIDYRRLNAVTIKDCYPMPLIDDILDVLGKAKLFSTMDIASGYWNVPMAANSIDKTAFTCKYGLFEWLVMPFGLCNAVPAFERLMKNVLIDLKWRTCLVYLDDCVVFSEDFPTHLVRLKQVLEHFRAAGFKLKIKKCNLGRDQVAFLGHIVTPSGILPNPEKAKAVMNVQRPYDLYTVRASLGLTSYFRRYIPGYAAISAPIERLKAKGVPFVWNDDCEAAFLQLKRKLVEPPILVYPDFSKRFKLYVDSSKLAMGACLMQTVDGRERVVAYASKLLVGSEKNWIYKQDGTSGIECWGIVWATRKFRCYLDRREFDFVSQGGASMGHVDGLSRLHSDSVCAVSMADLLNDADTDERHTPLVGEGSAGDDRDSETPDVYPGPAGRGSAEVGESGPAEGDLAESSGVPTDQLLVSPVDVFGLQQDRFLAEQRRTPWIQAMLAYLESGALALDPQIPTRTLLMAPNYAARNGVLMRRVHLQARAGPANSLEVPVIPVQSISTVLHHCHADVLAAHVGVTKTMDKVRKHAFWHGWKRDVAEYVRECSICGSGKGHRPWRNGLMQRMPIHELPGPFSLLVVDAVGPLVPTPRGNKFILVFADYFTRWVEAFSIQRLDSTTFIETMVNEVISRHGLPERLLKVIWCGLPPQTQGLVERFNGTLLGLLRLFVKETQTDWDLYLPRVLFAYRTSYHEALRDSPFFSLYGRDPVLPLDMAFLNTNHEWKSNEVASYRRRLFLSLRDTRRMVERQLIKAQDRHARRLEGQTDTKFEVGDPVWVYQYFRARRGEKKTKKLAFSWHGPYRVVGTVDENAFRVAIPTHPNRVITVNVNRRKRFQGRWNRPYPSEVPSGVDSEPGVDDNGPLTEGDLPSTSFVERLVVGGEETAFSELPGDRYYREEPEERRRTVPGFDGHIRSQLACYHQVIAHL
ncbi:unnamed protein product [Phytophthora fragariaefolia]|uniref:Unnamed protein product n=1 Tax=Phytophthora fragariaefolia TaxID=1490495 RepID=A0A9W7CT56_9STRA|nr:unnamed protein product [Phytophthora fragariaefolia]